MGKKLKNKFGHSSQQWLKRQMHDPYVKQAGEAGYRSRAAFKLLEIDDKYKLIRPRNIVLDLGAAPGSWSQVVMQKLCVQKASLGASCHRFVEGSVEGATKVSQIISQGALIAVDLQDTEILTVPANFNYAFIKGDFTDNEIQKEIIEKIDLWIANLSPQTQENEQKTAAAAHKFVDVILSDMAPNASGNAIVDHLRIINLAEKALDFARGFLKPGGHFVVKIWQGSQEAALWQSLKLNFKQVRRLKPKSSRQESAEIYLIGLSLVG